MGQFVAKIAKGRQNENRGDFLATKRAIFGSVEKLICNAYFWTQDGKN